VPTTDHKTIGTMHLVTSFAFFLIGGVMALLPCCWRRWPRCGHSRMMRRGLGPVALVVVAQRGSGVPRRGRREVQRHLEILGERNGPMAQQYVDVITDWTKTLS
jgi:hypothetical protein